MASLQVTCDWLDFMPVSFRAFQLNFRLKDITLISDELCNFTVTAVDIMRARTERRKSAGKQRFCIVE